MKTCAFAEEKTFVDLRTFDPDASEITIVQEVVNHFLFKTLKKVEKFTDELNDVEKGRVLLLKYRPDYVFIDNRGKKHRLGDMEELNSKVSDLKRRIFNARQKAEELSELKNYA